MEKEEKKNNVNLLLIFIIVVLAVLCILFATGTINLNNNSSNNNGDTKENNGSTNNASNVVGVYKTKFDSIKDDTGEVATAVLTLFENGIFTYNFRMYASNGTLGNYIVDGNKIILNNWFNTGSDISLYVTKGTKTLIINNDGSITDNNIKNSIMTNYNITTATFVKDGVPSNFDLSSRLYSSDFVKDKIDDPAM